MARLALTIAGGIIGGLLALPTGGVSVALGFSIGSAIGGIVGQLAFPGKGTHVYGPRLNDMQVSSSAPGTPIPLVYGSMRMGGQIIWSGGLLEVSTDQTQSAKGGPSVTNTTYTYFVSFAAAFCQGVAGVTRIWGDTKLIYNRGGNFLKGNWNSGTSYGVDDIVVIGATYYIALHDNINQNPASGTFFNNILGDLYWAQCAKPLDAGNVAKNVHTVPTLYTGSETQLQDPLMVSKDGVAKVPAYRGVCYAVWEKFPLVDFGNRLPNIRAEVHTNPVPSPQTVLTGFQSPADTAAPQFIAMSPDKKTVWAMQIKGTGDALHIYIERIDALTNTVTNSGFLNGLSAINSNYVPTGDTPPQGPIIADVNGNLWMQGRAGGQAVLWKIDGRTFQAVGQCRLFHLTADGLHYTGTFYGNPIAMSLDASGTGIVGVGYYSNWSGLYYNGLTVFTCDSGGTLTGQYPFNNGDSTTLVGPVPIVDENNMSYFLMGNGSPSGVLDGTGWSVFRINPAGGLNDFLIPPNGYLIETGIFIDAKPVLGGAGNARAMLYNQDDRTMIIFFEDGHAEKWDIENKKLLASASLGYYVTSGAIGDGNWNSLSPQNANTGSNSSNGPYAVRALFGKVQGGIFLTPGNTILTAGNIRAYNATDLTFIAEYNLYTWPGMNTGMLFSTDWYYDPTSDSIVIMSLNEPAPGWPATFPDQYAVYRLYLDRVNGSGNSAAFIVQDICERAGIPVGAIDVSLLENIHVTGYPIPQIQTGKDMINNLGQTYFFEGRESDFKVQFIPRGQAAAATVAEKELGLVDDHAALVENIGQEQDLPKDVEIIYIDQLQDYQQNKAHKVRHHKVRKTINKTSISLPLVLTARQAEQLADRILWTADMERRSYKTNLWKAYWLLLDPCDVINFDYNGLQLTGRVATMTLGLNMAVALEIIAEDNNTYLSVSAGNSDSGFIPQVVAGLATTQLWIFDIPYLRDQDVDAAGNTGFYAALAPSTGGGWAAGLLFKSGDGQSWQQMDASSTAPAYGLATTTLPAPLYSAYSWDYKSSFTVRAVEGAVPVSDTEINVLNGSNAALLFPSLEVIQYRDVVDNGDGTYTLSTLLRGRRGTEWAVGNHAAGEAVFFLNIGGVIHEQLGLSAIQSSRTYKGVTAGADISTGAPQNAAIIGRDLMPYAPSHFQGQIGGGGDITLTWIRRTRYGGDWLNGGENPGIYGGPQTGLPVPLNEDAESYDVEIVNSTGAVVRTVAGITSPTLLYTAAQQIADFGSLRTAVRARVYQNSAQVGRGFVTDNANVLGGLAPLGGG